MSSSTDSIFKIESLFVKRSESLIVDNLSFDVKKGDPFAIVGESGSGKTTLLFAALGLLPIESGKILIQGKNILKLNEKDRSQIAGLVFQDYQLFPHLNVLDNILLAPRTLKLDITKTNALELLSRLNIDSLTERYPHELSGGQKQRVAIARSLILKPKVLFFDEPSAALDEKTSIELARLAKDLTHETQVIIVSHDRVFIENSCTRGIRIQKGKIISTGDINQILNYN